MAVEADTNGPQFIENTDLITGANLNGTNGRSFNGAMDDLAIYNLALSKRNIWNLYQRQSYNGETISLQANVNITAPYLGLNAAADDIVSTSNEPTEKTKIQLRNLTLLGQPLQHGDEVTLQAANGSYFSTD